ncbi:MAG TPA: LpqB family beta-propeller domain-containing protein [Candidatus Nanopelagicales bacterium]
MTRPGPRWWRTGGLLAVAAAVLAGCASIPTSGPIHEGPAVAIDNQELIYRAIPQPPQPGMSPEELVLGFLAASSSAGDGYSVAREFLTPAAASSWNPLSQVRVYDNSGIQTRLTAPGAVSVTGTEDGVIGSDGGFVVAEAGKKFQAGYRLVRVGKDWRIAALPKGLVLGSGDIEREFRTYDLYFFDPTFSVVTPDAVTVPVTGAGAATVLVSSLLSGPTSWLAPAVRTAFPEGTTLTLDSVPVVSGVAQVDLSPQVLEANDQARQALSAQLVWTLHQLPNVTGVAITVGGQPLPIPGVGPVQSVDSWQRYDPDEAGSTGDAYAGASTGLVRLGADGRFQRAAGAVGHGRPLLIAPSVSLDEKTVAGITPDRRQLWTQLAAGETPPVLVGRGTDLSRASFDRTGALWWVDRGSGVFILQNGRPTARVPIVGLPAGMTSSAIEGVSIARDGTRAALLVRRGGAVEPWVARIERDGTNVRLAAPRRLEMSVTDALDLAWEAQDQLAVLGTSTRNGLGLQVFVISDGFSQTQSQPAVPGATSLAAAPGAATLLGVGGKVYVQNPDGWTALGAGNDPAYPG